MIDIRKPTYTIRNIATVTAAQLKSEGIGGLAFARARGILTSADNTDWFPHVQSLRNLGAQGIRLYLVADKTVNPDLFMQPNNQLEFKHIARVADSPRPLRDGLAEISRTIVTSSDTESEVLQYPAIAVVGNWLPDIAEGNRAGFPTILMPELLGAKGLRAVIYHPVEAAARVVRGVPFRTAAFSRGLKKDGYIIETNDDKTEEPADQTPEKA